MGSQLLLFAVLGLGVGAIYASIGMNLVLTYEGTGVINFAAPAMAAVALYVDNDLTTSGDLSFAIPGLPSVNVGDPGTWGAIGISLVAAALVGVIVDFCASRPLRNAPLLARVVGTVAAMLTLNAAISLKYGTISRTRPNIFPTKQIDFLGTKVPEDQLCLALSSIGLGLLLIVFFRRTRLGLSMRAAAENERAASFARLSPQRLGTCAWIIANVFLTFMLILGGPTVGLLDPTSLTLLVVPGFAAALIGRFTSVGWSLAGGLTLGVIGSELTFLSNTKSWWPGWAHQGLSDAVPFVVVIIALFLTARRIPTRADSVTIKMPPAIVPKGNPITFGVTVVAGVVLLFATSGSYRFGVINSFAVMLIMLSVVVLTGFVGQISLAQAAFAGAAAFALAKIGSGIPFPLSLVVSVLIATLAGVVIGVPALRIRGVQLGVVTIAAALAVQSFVFGNPSLLSPNGDMIPNPKLFGLDLAVRQGHDIARAQFGLFTLVVVALSFLAVGNVLRGTTGRVFLAVRANERAATAVGINVARAKLSAFALSAALAGLGGCLIGYSRGQPAAASFSVLIGLGFIATVYVTGITGLSGAVLAGLAAPLGLVYVFVDRELHWSDYYTAATGVLLLLSVLFNPIGAAGQVRLQIAAVRRRLRPAAVATEEAPADHEGTVEVDLRSLRVEGAAKNGAPVLDVRGLTVRYGGLRAVDSVDLVIRPGEIIGLIGPNGAGKTSFVDALTGFTGSTGEVELAGQAITGLTAHRRARAGMVRTWQALELFDDLSVRENVAVGSNSGRPLQMARDVVRPGRSDNAAVTTALDLLGLDAVADRRPGELSLGRQKALGVARAASLAPKVLLLDEPAAGLSTYEGRELASHLVELAQVGLGLLLIEHDMDFVFGICDRVYVLEFGKVIAHGRPDEVRRDPAVIAAYLGTSAEEPPMPTVKRAPPRVAATRHGDAR